MIFVFGSNTAGIHGLGAAKYAVQHEGAKYGIGYGRIGNSFAIPTKDSKLYTLPIKDVRKYVDMFIDYAFEHIDEEFKVTMIGCGLAGFRNNEIAPMFIEAPNNCYFDTEWQPILGPKGFKYWGHFK